MKRERDEYNLLEHNMVSACFMDTRFVPLAAITEIDEHQAHTWWRMRLQDPGRQKCGWLWWPLHIDSKYCSILLTNSIIC